MTDFKNNFSLSLRVMKSLVLVLLIFAFQSVTAQENRTGAVVGNLMDENQKAIVAATVRLINSRDSLIFFTATTDRDGDFSFENLPFGLYQLKLSHVGFQNLVIDSIHIVKKGSVLI
jgi:hypothetical protein